MPSITVSDKSLKIVKRYLESHRPGKAATKALECESLVDAADKLIDYADRRQAALEKNNAKARKKPRAPKAKKAAAPKKARAPKAPKTGLAKKLAKSKKAEGGAPKLKGNRKKKVAEPSAETVTPETTPSETLIDGGDDEDNEPDPLAHTPREEGAAS